MYNAYNVLSVLPIYTKFSSGTGDGKRGALVLKTHFIEGVLLKSGTLVIEFIRELRVYVSIAEIKSRKTTYLHLFIFTLA